MQGLLLLRAISTQLDCESILSAAESIAYFKVLNIEEWSFYLVYHHFTEPSVVSSKRWFCPVQKPNVCQFSLIAYKAHLHICESWKQWTVLKSVSNNWIENRLSKKTIDYFLLSYQSITGLIISALWCIKLHEWFTTTWYKNYQLERWLIYRSVINSLSKISITTFQRIKTEKRKQGDEWAFVQSHLEINKNFTIWVKTFFLSGQSITKLLTSHLRTAAGWMARPLVMDGLANASASAISCAKSSSLHRRPLADTES